MFRRLPTGVDRYPGKMNQRLARDVAKRFVGESRIVLDPFCGSGALLAACAVPGRRLVGIDVNPVAVLLSSIRMHGFDAQSLREGVEEMVALAKAGSGYREVDWNNKSYWFTPAVLRKFERLRGAATELERSVSRQEWSALLLCLAMAVRGCSRADQRSPKPFISAIARAERKGRHYCPYRAVLRVLEDLIDAHCGREEGGSEAKIIMGDVVRDDVLTDLSVDCVATSPPYLNAQDYFRNTKLELYILEGLMHYRTEDLKERFVGTERGSVERDLDGEDWNFVRELVDDFAVLEERQRRLAAVVVRYFRDMSVVFGRVAECVAVGGRLVVVCGDNLVGGVRIDTSSLLGRILEGQNFSLVESFADRIRDRVLAPRRKGHQGLIKEEIVSCYLKE